MLLDLLLRMNIILQHNFSLSCHLWSDVLAQETADHTEPRER